MKYNNKKYLGLRSGYLTVKGYEHGRFVCECACGNKTSARPYDILKGVKKSCSQKECRYAQKLRYYAKYKHGLTGTRLYTIWNGMIGRCYRPNNPNYKDYGGRGIRICDEWRSDIHNFINWAMENGYGETLSIDRINVNGNYEPFNCRWVDYKTQVENRRAYVRPKRKASKHIWTIDGETKAGKEWCEKYGLSYPTVLYRIKAWGISPKEALTMEKVQSGRPKKGNSI